MTINLSSYYVDGIYKKSKVKVVFFEVIFLISFCKMTAIVKPPNLVPLISRHFQG